MFTDVSQYQKKYLAYSKYSLDIERKTVSECGPYFYFQDEETKAHRGKWIVQGHVFRKWQTGLKWRSVSHYSPGVNHYTLNI